MERGWKEMSPNCPRCGSSNTKFCYYNNYSLTQPRYFCKGCRRYWTKGGSLRNVPVGGGCRKSRRGNKTPLRLSNAATTTPYSNATPVSCRTTTGVFGQATINAHQPSPTSSSSTSTIDLAAVYANYLNPKKPEEHQHNHHHHHRPYYHDQLISPHADLVLSAGLSNPAYLGGEDEQLILLHDHHKQQDHQMLQNPSSSVHDHDPGINEFRALLPPLPGEGEVVALQELAVPWVKSNNSLLLSASNGNGESSALPSTMQDHLEAELQFSNSFNIDGPWSPLDFSSYPDIQTSATAATTTAAGSIRQMQWP